MRKRKSSKTPLMVLGAGVFLIIVAVAVLISQTNAAAPAANNSSQATAGIQRVSPLDAKNAMSAGTAIIVDVRSAEAYAGGHIDGAVSLPEADIETRLAEFDPNQWIITYCT